LQKSISVILERLTDKERHWQCLQTCTLKDVRESIWSTQSQTNFDQSRNIFLPNVDSFSSILSFDLIVNTFYERLHMATFIVGTYGNITLFCCFPLSHEMQYLPSRILDPVAVEYFFFFHKAALMHKSSSKTKTSFKLHINFLYFFSLHNRL